MENFGFISAFLAAIAWGSYVVPFKRFKSSNSNQFQILMTVGIFIFSLIASLFLGYSFNLNSYGIVGGFIWALANALSLVAVSNLGMSRAVPIWVSMVILTSFAWGAFFFHELPKGIFLGMGGIFLIILSIILIGSTGNSAGKRIGKGILLAIFAGMLFGSSLT
ncbi:GRP family sugar transporter, partial [Patescibacteria group bacterium]|nr:GRP family sugar transporter [Patescibacteria group bacterium]